VLGNLIKNSVDFVPADNGKINVRVEYDDGIQNANQRLQKR
jgi:signal transduction histidine kinase